MVYDSSCIHVIMFPHAGELIYAIFEAFYNGFLSEGVGSA